MKKIRTAVLILLAALCLGLIAVRLNMSGEAGEEAPAETPGAFSEALPESAPVPEPAVSATPVSMAVPESEPSPVPSAPSEFVPASAPESEPSPQTEESAFPEPRLYSFGVEAGKIRYVSQAMDLDGNGWGKYSWKAGMECTTACISMALSYLGIDESPEALLDFSSKTYLCSAYGLEEISVSAFSAASYTQEEAAAAFVSMTELYLNCTDGSVSPVLVYFSGCGHNHAILVIGREGEEYLVLDPAFLGIFRIRISENGDITATDPEYLSRYTDGGETPAKLVTPGQWVKNG